MAENLIDIFSTHNVGVGMFAIGSALLTIGLIKNSQERSGAFMTPGAPLTIVGGLLALLF